MQEQDGWITQNHMPSLVDWLHYMLNIQIPLNHWFVAMVTVTDSKEISMF